MIGLPPGIVRLVVGEIETNCYFVLPVHGNAATVIDPGGDSEGICRELAFRHLTIGSVLLTHAHIDHVLGLPGLLHAMGPSPVLMHGDDRPLWDSMCLQAEFLGVPAPELPADVEEITDGQILQGSGLVMEILHLPGHSPGSVGVLLPEGNALLSGDTLFRQGVGRTDLWGGSWDRMHRSIEQRVLPLPPHTVILPGHGEPTTVAEARRWCAEVKLSSWASTPM